MTEPSRTLPPLRRHRPPWNLARLAARVSGNIRAVEKTVDPFAEWWDEQNARTMEQSGPLWVVLGDSTAQGIGASAPNLGFVSVALEQLRQATGEPWRVINLSMSGGRFADAANVQIPVIEKFALKPRLVSAVIGSNDLVWRMGSAAILDDARRFVDAAPSGLVLSRVAERPRDPKRRGINAIFGAAEALGALSLFNVWDWPPAREMWASDRFHPNETAYRVMAELTVDALLRKLER